MIRALKGTFSLVALVTLGCFLRWATAGSITGLRTYDLDSLITAAVSTVAWIAYVWLTLAVVLTALEQLPGVLGTLAGALAHRITTQTARTLLRTALGAAALAPLALPAAQATSPTHPATSRPFTPSPPTPTSLPSPRTATSLPTTPTGPHTTPSLTTPAWPLTTPSRTTPASRPAASATADLATPSTTTAGLRRAGQTRPDLRLAAYPNPAQLLPGRPGSRVNGPSAVQEPARGEADQPTDAGSPHQAAPTPPNGSEPAQFRAIEPGSRLHLSGTDGTPSTTPPDQTQVFPPNRPTGQVQADPSARPTQHVPTHPPARPTGQLGDDPRNQPNRHQRVDPRNGSTAGVRVGVPDRPTGGAPNRYTRLRLSAPTVVVREGDSLWRIAARELGPTATAESIAARCQAWYSANLHVIGNNPNLIFPGQVLRVPPVHGDHHPPGVPPGAAR